jgi:uridine kinase
MRPAVAGDADTLAEIIAGSARQKVSPFVVAIDGRSGVGKSTLARALAERLDACVIDGDEFYVGGIELRMDSLASRAAACIDWTRQRSVLEALAAGRTAHWRAFDWDAFDGRLCGDPKTLEPRPVVILEGVYAARPELADLLDLRVVLVAPGEVRLARLAAREGTIGSWERQWHEAEEFYFDAVMPIASFDVVVTASTDQACDSSRQGHS